MKNKIFLSLIFSCFIFNSSIAQHKKNSDWIENTIASSDIYVKYGSNKPHNLDITNANILKLFGKPLKIESGISEMTELKYKDYTYPFGIIDIEDNILNNIEFKRPGLAYVFKLKNGFSKPVSVGSDAVYLKQFFPKSWRLMKGNSLSVWIEKCDCNISFEISGGKIKSMMFFTNNS